MLTLTLVFVAAALGTVFDIRTRRLPNWLTGAIAAAGVVTAATGLDGRSLAMAAASGAIALGLGLPGYVLGRTGAGDVKFLAALGMHLQPGQAAVAFLLTCVAGGLFAVVWAACRGVMRETLQRTAALATGHAGPAADGNLPDEPFAFPYGPAVATGVVLSWWVRL